MLVVEFVVHGIPPGRVYVLIEGNRPSGFDKNNNLLRWAAMPATTKNHNRPPVFVLDELDEVIARCYLRVSKDESGRARSNSEQLDDAVKVCTRKRWTLGESYGDVGSASKFKKKEREHFDRLMADLRADRFGAHVLILWEASRGSREVPEWYELLTLCESRGVHVMVTSRDARVFNPAGSYDWKELVDMGTQAEFEVRQLRERQARATKADAEAGTWRGRRMFGYEPNGSALRHGQVDGTIDEATIVREMVRRSLAGETTRSLAADLNRRGILTSAGNPWHPNVLGNLIRSPRIAGKRAVDGVIVGDGDWPAIIDEVTHRRVVAAMATRTQTGRRGRTPWLLTGFLRCERCLGALSSHQDSRGVKRYRCRKGPGYNGCGGLTIKAAPLEEMLGDAAIRRLSDVEARRAAALGPDDDGEVAELAQIEVLFAEAHEDRANGGDRGEYNALCARLRARRDAVNARLAAKVRETAPLDHVIDAGYVGRPWKDTPDADKRVLLDALVDYVTVGPVGRGATKFDASRADGDRITWKV